MQAMSLYQSYSRFRMICLLLLLCILGNFTFAFELDLPSDPIILNEPATIDYRMEQDGSDETCWMMNITDIDGRNPETLNSGEIFNSSQGYDGSFEVTIDRAGVFLLKAVNPNNPSQGYATSLPALVIDESIGGIGSGTGSGSGSSSNGGDDGDGDGSDDGGDDGDGDGDDGDDGTGGDGHTSSITSSIHEDSTAVSASQTPASSATRTPMPVSASSKNPNTKTGLIAGCITAGVITFLLILAALFFFRRSRGSRKPSRRFTFYRDRMIRAPTPPGPTQSLTPVLAGETVQVQERRQSILRNPHPSRGSVLSVASYPGPPVIHIGSGSGAGMTDVGAGAYGMHQPSMNQTYPYRTPNSATATGADPSGSKSPALKEFILRSPRSVRPLPQAPLSPGGGFSGAAPVSPSGLKEFILKSPRNRDSFAGYSRP